MGVHPNVGRSHPGPNPSVIHEQRLRSVTGMNRMNDSVAVAVCHPPLPDRAMIGENRQLVTDEPVEFENNRVKFKIAGNLPIILEEFMEYTPI
jgi:hypothetical protein